MSIWIRLFDDDNFTPTRAVKCSLYHQGCPRIGIIRSIVLDYNCNELLVDVEVILSRIIKPETTGKDRNRLMKAVAIALRELVRQPDITAETRELAAFIALALEEIHETIDPSVLAWEKRGYWVKADRFRMDWAWTGQQGAKMRKAIMDDDWASVALVASEIAKKVNDVKIPMQNRSGTPWTGAYQKLLKLS